MLTESADELHTDYTSPADKFNEDSEATNSSQRLSVTDAAAEKRLADEELDSLRELFLKAEIALQRKNDTDYFMLADQLEGYPLYPYLQYQWLKNHLDRERQVTHFLEEHESSRYAAILKRRWLFHLAKKKQWQTFIDNFSATSNTRLNCYYHLAQYHTGEQQAALEGAKKLWAVGRSQPKTCDPLFAELKKSNLFNQELFWLRFDAALQNNKTSLAKYVKKLMTVGDQRTADLWLELHRDPETHIPELLSRAETPQTGSMFAHAINRLARKDVYLAIDFWDNNKQRFDISAEQSNKVEKRLALKLAYKNESDAYERLGSLNESDYKSKAWRVRVALYEQNWPAVITAIEDLSSENRKLEKWQYWLARAYQETGKPIQADELLSELSTKRDFYGYLAADRLNREYQLKHNPLDVSEAEIEAIKNHKEFLAAHEFMMLGRINDAKQQWWHALKQLDKNDYPAAAKLAQQWQWDTVAIFTIAKVKYWDDVELRFPLSYSDKIQENAALQNLNPVILYGLIRRESAFNKDARSPSGARGLMQIMPRTGMQIAKDLKERWSGKNSLYDPVKNLKYGSYYYQKLLNEFNGHYAIALAAYNAGPNRVKKWLPDESTPADIWIETIPFTETRDYVATVLVYAMIYQQRMQTDELTMADLTREIPPLIDVAAK
ncbi:MAG: transglycosylase SLT domain-containing protein [Thiotrichales bacterium]|nr:MAG: transglycosylase SLT domain-containing protein [Thiotrichales bacterium]